jgi:NADP-dependent 3-hydroxy acid dehydrogenase YdfG
MNIKDSVVLVTGASRAARDPSKISLTGVTPLRLDVTNPAEVAAVAAQCQDVTLLINNPVHLELGKYAENRRIRHHQSGCLGTDEFAIPAF